MYNCYRSLNQSVNLIFQLLEIDYVSKEISDSGLLFLFRTDFSVINYDNKALRQILLPVLTLLCHFKFFLLLAKSQRSL